MKIAVIDGQGGGIGKNIVDKVDVIVGSIAILAVNGLLGEVTPRMAEAIAGSKAKKLLLPMNRINIEIVGVANEPLPHQIQQFN